MNKICCCFSRDDSRKDEEFPLFDYRTPRDVRNVEESLFTAMHNFTPFSFGDLSFSVGDKIRLLEDIVPGQNWYQAVNLTTKEKGSIPLNFLGRNLESELWWFPGTTYFEAETLLLWDGNDTGCFLVRPSTNPAAPYALSVRSKDARGIPTIKHYKINYVNGSYYISESMKTANLQNLIKAYLLSNSVNLGLCENITHPCAKLNPELYELGQEFITKEEIDHQEITLDEKPLAAGNYSYVYRAKWRDLIVAVKVPRETKLDRESFIKEVKMMKMLRHKNIIALYGVCTALDLNYIVLEYMDQGSLLGYVKENTLSHYQRIYVVTQIASAMSYLESKKVVHRDLAARNVLLKGKLHVKLADFGLSRFLSEEKKYIPSTTTAVATKWIAPEYFRHHGYSTKSDVWSFAILLMEIYTNGETPYAEISNCTKDKLIKLVANGYIMKAPDDLPENIYNLMKLCWNHEPEKRPSFCEVETFFSNYERFENFNFMGCQ